MLETVTAAKMEPASHVGAVWWQKNTCAREDLDARVYGAADALPLSVGEALGKGLCPPVVETTRTPASCSQSAK